MSLFFFLISFCYFRSNGTDFGSKSIQTLNTVQDFYTFFRFYFKNFFIPHIPLPTHTPIVNMSEATFPVFYLL